MTNFAPSSRHETVPVNTEAEQRYREELIGRVVDQSRGKVGLYTTMDLDASEKDSLAASLTERGADRSVPSRAGWQDYGDVSLTDLFSRDPSLGGLANLSKLTAQETGTAAGNERAVFFIDESGTDMLLYQMGGFNDDTGRSGNVVTISMPLEASMAQELYSGALNDPSLLDQVAIAQVQALGLGAREDAFFRFTYGPAQRGGKDTWFSQDGRSKAIHRRDASGAVSGTEVLYADKRPLEVPGAQETTVPTVDVAPQSVVEYDVEQNAIDNEVRRAVSKRKSKGITHVELLLNLDDEARSAGENNDMRGASARNTVFNELAQEPIDLKELEAIGLTDENYSDTESAMRQEIADAVDYFTNDGADVTAMQRVIGVLQMEVARIEGAFGPGMPDMSDAFKDAAMLRESVLMEIAEQLEQRLAGQ